MRSRHTEQTDRARSALRCLISRIPRIERRRQRTLTLHNAASQRPRSVTKREGRGRPRARWETVNVGGRDCFLVNRNLGSEKPRPRAAGDNAERGDSGNNTVRTGAAHCGIMRNYICI